MTNFLQSLIGSVTIGSSYALLGIGIALVFGVMRLVNFAQGDLVMVGAYGATLVSHGGWELQLAVTLIVPIIFALLMEVIAFRPVRETTEATMLITSFAVSYLLENLALLFFGATPRSINLAPSINQSIHEGGLTIPRLDIATVAASIALMAAVAAFLYRTRLGLHLRAASEDFSIARVLGVRANRVISASFAISGLVCGVSAYFLTSQTGEVYSTMGLNAVLVAFIATTLGGLGSVLGAVIGGYALGIATVFLGAYLPAGLSAYTDAFAYAAVILVLLYRPQGLIAPRGAGTRV